MKIDPQQAGQDRLDLATALKELRRASGLSGERLAVRCGMSQSKVSRIETGRFLPSVVDVQQILRALGLDDATAADLLSLAQVANAEYEDVRTSVRRGLHHRQRELAALESGARHMRHFLPAMVTGLLQTPDYMRQALSPAVEPAGGDISRAMGLKLERQGVLHDQSKRFEFLLTESAVRWQLCDASAMAVQIDHLVSVSRLPNVHLSVLPLGRRVTDAPFHTFVTYDDRLVTAELFSGQVVLRDPKDVDYYRELFDFFAEHSADEEDARAILESWADGYRAQSMRERD
ncbi:helix-turn-helix domain-containing protein [Streptomyces sp. NPDC102274]|uniref:helix-turn-helix domain-containing protein n=1 Tax=Streptomyces sp. NPDC102274 TaxID=3366151 RepID=UPI00380EC463